MEVGEVNSENAMYHILFDGSISDRKQYAVIGGQAEEVTRFLKDHYREHSSLADALLDSKINQTWHGCYNNN